MKLLRFAVPGVHRGVSYRLGQTTSLEAPIQKFTPSTIVPARRFVLAGSAAGIWFVLYEHEGIAYHHDLIVFSKNGHWQIVAALQGTVKVEVNLESLKQAVKRRPIRQSGRPP